MFNYFQRQGSRDLVSKNSHKQNSSYERQKYKFFSGGMA